MGSKPCTFAELIQNRQLTEEDCSKQVSEQHLVLFSRSHCGQWRQLPAFLELETAVAEGIYHARDDESKRYSFLLKCRGGSRGVRQGAYEPPFFSGNCLASPSDSAGRGCEGPPGKLASSTRHRAHRQTARQLAS